MKFRLLFLAALSGCTVGPDWQKPQPEAPQGWRIEYREAVEVANTRWWEAFGDPVLDKLVGDALQENRDLAQAAARVDQFLGALRATRSQFYPQLGYAGDAGSNRISANGPTQLPAGADRTYSLYDAALSASWQIDLFGRVRRQAESAQAQVYSSEQGRRGVVLSVVSAVATGYIALRGADRQLEIARATEQNYEKSLDLFERRHQAGTVSELERSQVESQYRQAQAAVPALVRQVQQQENLLSVLLGRNPGPIPRGRTIEALLDPAIPAALPSSLLERRPDILQAEQGLRAANANIGAAKALYFPTLSLTGIFGLQSTSLDNFAKSSSTTGSITLGITGPIFTFGAVEGQVATAEAARREALAFYENVVFNAFRETNDALVGVQTRREEYEALAKRTQALRTYARLSQAKYDGGQTSYIEVLYAQNELFAAELNAISSLTQRHAELVGLYKALGGGWVDAADPLAPPGRTGR
jgi:outer membrane protein, multidrug efflux system